jgi:hypothetical protein
VFILSDHGFAARPREKTRIHLDLDRLLAHFGFLEYREGGVDIARSQLVTFASNPHDRVKKVRFVSAEARKERERLRSELEGYLATVTYASGEGALRVRDADSSEQAAGADFIVEVSPEGVSQQVFVDARPLEGVVVRLVSVSGRHPGDHPGVLMAAGPDIDPDARLRPVRVHDITPTVLYALGLPVAEDFAGRPITELFTEEFQAAHPLGSIPSWGRTRAGSARPSAVDKTLVEQLEALGYLDE